MADRFEVILTEPADDSLPLDMQGVAMRRRAIDLMSELGNVIESSVRYKGATDMATVTIGGDIGLLTTWQHNVLAARFIADGTADKEICGAITHADRDKRHYSSASVVRNEFNT